MEFGERGKRKENEWASVILYNKRCEVEDIRMFTESCWKQGHGRERGKGEQSKGLNRTK
jgi:hypothetical protein